MTFPTNIADAAAAIRDGDVGLFETVKIQDLTVSALTAIDYTDSMIITERPMQAGYRATDAATKVMKDVSIDICLSNPDYSIEAGVEAFLGGGAEQLTTTWREKRDTLYEYFESKTVVSFQSHERVFENMMIQDITPYHEVNNLYDAFFANVILKEIKFTGQESTDYSTDVSKRAASKTNVVST